MTDTHTPAPTPPAGPPAPASNTGSLERRSRARFSEAAVIVLSILAALFVDALWDYASDRMDEREYLEGLALEFTEAAEELGADQTVREMWLDRLRRLMEVRASADTIPSDSVPDYLQAVIDYRFYSPSHPVLEDLVASGNLGLIRSDAVRNALLLYEETRSRLDYSEGRDNTFLSETVSPFVAARLALDRVMGPGVGTASSADVEQFHALLRDDEMGSLIYLRWFEMDWSRRFGGDVERVIELALRVIGEELD